MRPPFTGVAVLFIVVALFLYCTVVHGESLTTSNLVPGMSAFTTSGGTSFGTGSGCDEGAYCTAGTNQEGGTYSSTFDVPLTEAEIQQGFTLDSGVTISSHISNTRLETCGDVLQSGDCRDIFSLTISLLDAGVTVEQFIHQEEMDFEGLRAFTFTDTVAANDYGVLTGLFELFGIDAGFPSSFFGPQFSDPALTIGYQTVLIQEQVVAEVQTIIEAQVEAEIIQVAAVEPPPALPDITETALPTFSEPTTETAAAPLTATVAPIEVTPELPTFTALPAIETATATADLAPPPAPVETVIAPIAPPPTETQQAQNTEAEAQIAEVQAQPEAQAEAQPEPEAQAEAQAEPETQAEAAPTTEPEPEPEPETETETREAEPADTPPPAKETPKAVAKAAPKAKAKRMTPAVAAQTVVNNIAPSQRYGYSAQVVTLVAMTLIGETAALLKQPTSLTDVAAYADIRLADGPSMIDRLTNYRMFGQANGIHAALIESQWRQ